VTGRSDHSFDGITELFNSDFMRFQTTDIGSGDRETLVTRPNPAQAQMDPAKAGNEDSIHRSRYLPPSPG
jgi:hypothetical protein